MSFRTSTSSVLVTMAILLSLLLGSVLASGNAAERATTELRRLGHHQRSLTAADSCASQMMEPGFAECITYNSFYTDSCGGSLVQPINGAWCTLDDLGEDEGVNEVCCGTYETCCEISSGGKALGSILLAVIVLSVILCSCACCRYVVAVAVVGLSHTLFVVVMACHHLILSLPLI